MFDKFKTWVASPFSADMDLPHWFYFIGLLMIIVVLWQIILKHITEGIDG